VRGPIDRVTERLPERYRTIADWVITIALAVVAVFLIKAFVINPYKIPSASMEPTFHCAHVQPDDFCEAGSNDRIIANRLAFHFRSPKRGDIVVFSPPPSAGVCGPVGTYVKRIVGLPGETIEERQGVVYVNGRKLDEPYISAGRRDTDSVPPRKLGPDDYFMMGDNRAHSCDSRVWGPVHREDMIGTVLMVYWPLSRIGFR
jgi:signal peptidase I